jgi:hypothetical protein
LDFLGVDYQYDDFKKIDMEWLKIPDEHLQGYDTLSETDI